MICASASEARRHTQLIARMGAGARPAPAGRADAIVLMLSALAIVAWAGNLWRLSRWRGLAARRDALVLVLHASYLLAALGFIAVGSSALWPARIPYAVGVHVSAIGAVGVMTLAMTTRATLGHTGHALVASKTTVLAYLCIIVALAAGIAMAIAPVRLFEQGGSCGRGRSLEGPPQRSVVRGFALRERLPIDLSGFSSKGRARAAEAMIAAVESDDPPLRLMLGADASAAWEKKEAAFAAELERWRSVGEATAYAGAAIKPVGG
jgi:NnrS protein